MSDYPTISTAGNPQRRWLVAVVAALAAIAALAAGLAFGTGTSTKQPAARIATHASHTTPFLMTLTPGAIAAGALGGYALPVVRDGADLSTVLASMSPQTRRYTERIMSLTFAQLAAGAAGHP